MNRVDPETGKTALHMAIEQAKDYDIVAKLIEAGQIHTKKNFTKKTNKFDNTGTWTIITIAIPYNNNKLNTINAYYILETY